MTSIYRQAIKVWKKRISMIPSIRRLSFSAAALSSPSMMILATLSGGWRSLFGMSVGSAVAVTAYVSKIFTPLENIGMEIENIQSAVAGIQRIEAFFRQPQRNLPEATLTLSTLPAGEPALALNHVTFGYEKGRNRPA